MGPVTVLDVSERFSILGLNILDQFCVIEEGRLPSLDWGAVKRPVPIPFFGGATLRRKWLESPRRGKIKAIDNSMVVTAENDKSHLQAILTLPPHLLSARKRLSLEVCSAVCKQKVCRI